MAGAASSWSWLADLHTASESIQRRARLPDAKVRRGDVVFWAVPLLLINQPQALGTADVISNEAAPPPLFMSPHTHIHWLFTARIHDTFGHISHFYLQNANRAEGSGLLKAQ